MNMGPGSHKHTGTNVQMVVKALVEVLMPRLQAVVCACDPATYAEDLMIIYA